MKRYIKVLSIAFILCLLLTACGGSTEKKIKGSWKIVTDGDVNTYLEIDEDRMIIRPDINEDPTTAEYILTKAQGDNFIMEVVNPETSKNEFLFEGHFKNKNTVTIDKVQDKQEMKDSKLIRVDNMAKEMKKDAEAKEKKRERERLAEEKEAKKAEKLAQEEEAKERKAQKLAEEQEAKKAVQLAQVEAKKADARVAQQQTTKESNSQKVYLEKADQLEQKILNELKRVDPNAQDMRPDFYGQYNEEWDNLLNEVWGVLRDTMSKNAFEALKSDQNKWIEKKEQDFAKMPEGTAWERTDAWGYLAMENARRTRYLIENYMN